MAYIAPNTDIILCRGVPFDASYANTSDFASPTAAYNYFYSKRYVTIPVNSYQRIEKGKLRIACTMEQAIQCNYLMFKNTNFENKWIYAFITGWNYINNITTEITYQIDVFHTFWNDVNLLQVFVEREHSSTDLIGENLMPEVLEQGEYVVDGGGSCLPYAQNGVRKNISYMAGATSQDMLPPILLSMAKKWCAIQEKPSYTWFFERQLPGDDKGAWHSSDLWYWFGTLDNCWRPMGEDDRLLSDVMTDYLCNFARSGNPNHHGKLPTWIASDKRQPRVMRLGGKKTWMGKPSAGKLIYTMLTTKPVGE